MAERLQLDAEVFERLYPEVERVIDLVVGALKGQEIPNGAIILGLGAVIGLTLNEQMPGKDKPEAPPMEAILDFLEVGMAHGRDMKIGRVQ
jgi:hypothetical protein